MTTDKMARTCSLLALASALWIGCDADGEEETARRTAALTSLDQLVAMEQAMRPGERLLSVGERGALVVGALPAEMPNTDQPRAFAPIRRVGDKDRALPDDLGQVLDVRALPDREELLILGADHRLWRVGADVALLDTEVEPPLSVSPSGQYVAYARGMEPLFEVVVRDEARHGEQVVSGELQGCWSPAVGDRGQVMFMSSSTGYGELYYTDGVDTPIKVTMRQQGQEIATPTGPSAPLLSDGALFFEDEQGLHRAARPGDAAIEGVRLVAPGAREIVWGVRGQYAWSQREGKVSAHELVSRGGV